MKQLNSIEDCKQFITALQVTLNHLKIPAASCKEISTALGLKNDIAIRHTRDGIPTNIIMITGGILKLKKKHPNNAVLDVFINRWEITPHKKKKV